MANVSDSPREIRSQIGDQEYNSDVENQDPTSTSQALFATQIPLRESPCKPGDGGREFKKPHVHQSIKNQDKNAYKTSCAGLQQDSNDCSQNSTRPSAGCVQNMSTPELTQRQIVVPSSNAPGAPQDQMRDADKTMSTGALGGTMGSQTGIPDALIDMLRAWRQECRHGRHIPRRLQVIPKDQVKLLESDDRWQPSLIGHTQRPGTVPIDLLNRLTKEADLQLPPTPQALDESLKNTADVREIHSKSLNQPLENAENSDENSSESSQPCSWSSSPERPPKHHIILPPDSSPAGVQQVSAVRIELGQNTEASDEHTANLSFTKEKLKRSSKDDYTHSSDVPVQPNAQICIQNTNTSPKIREIGSRTESMQAPPSTAPNKLNATVQNFERTVQVKRTPFIAKDVQNISDAPDSPSDIVPGTFNEGSTFKYGDQNPAQVAQSTRDSHSTGEVRGNAFEADSSEDEVALGISRSFTDNRTYMMDQTANVSELHSPDQRRQQKNPQPEVLSSTGKRKSRSNCWNSSKRSKTNHSAIMQNKEEDSDYRSIDEDRARYRREFLGRIARKEIFIEPIDSTAIQLHDENVTTSSKTSVQQTAAQCSPPQYLQGKCAGTPDTNVSIHQIAGQSRKASASTYSSMMVLGIDTSATQIELYNQFRSAYPDYGGEQKHFDAVFHVLKQLYLQNKATHPALWDDFIFRHHYEYREHLREVMETYGNALSYEKFYEECVEQPVYLNRVVKPLHMNSAYSRSVPITRSSLPPAITAANSFTSNAHMVKPTLSVAADKSVTADSPVSSIVPCKQSLEYNSKSTSIINNSGQVTLSDLRLHEYVDETVVQDHNPSQNSRTSVKNWLERASGAESPILGTPQADAEKSNNIPVLDLTNDMFNRTTSPFSSTSEPATKKTKRKLPWNKALNDTYQEIPCSSPVMSNSQSQPLSQPSSQPKSHTRPQLLPKSTSLAKEALVQEHNNLIVSGTTCDKNNIGSISFTSSTPSKITSKGQNAKRRDFPGPETTFQRYARFYSDLPDEKKAIREVKSMERPVDFFRWRN